MKTKILSLLLAISIGAGMLASTTNAGVPEMWFFEIQASGKGVEAVTDMVGPPAVYAESKHKLNPITLYAMYNRSSRVLVFAVPVESSATWVASPDLSVIETGTSLLPIIMDAFPIYRENVGIAGADIYGIGDIQIQFKEKDGVVKSARLKSLGMSYQEAFSPNPAQSTYRFGTLKMKGKMVDRADMLPEVLTAFGL